MAPTSSLQLSNFALRTIMEKDKLNGTNFTNWYRNLRIVLKQEKKDHVLEDPLPAKLGANQVLMVHPASKIKKGSWSRKKAKSKGGMSEGVPSTASVTKPAKPPVTVCYYCKEDGHCKRNCSKYLVDKSKGGSMTSDSGTLVVNVIDIYLAGSTSSTWVYDTGSVVHICNSMQGLARSRSVGRDEVDI